MHATRTISRETGRSRSLSPYAIRVPFALLALVGLLLGAAGVRAADEFLPVEQAFPVAASADGPNAVRVRWEVATGYYLYRTKLRFTSQTPGIVAGKPEMPTAETKHDAFFGEVPIYRGTQEIVVPIERAAGSGDNLDLEVGSQGCADAGFCYPPHRRTLRVALPPLAAVAPAPADPAPAVSPSAPPARLLDALGSRSLGVAEDDIPTVDQAFQLDAQVADPSQVKLHWDLAPGTYLYRSKVALALEGAEGVTLGSFELPPGDIKKDSILPDGSTGDVEVYHNRLDLALPLVRQTTSATDIELVAKYQGCAERGICYPPQTRRMRLSLPASAGAPAAAAATSVAPVATQPVASASAMTPAEPVSEQDRIAAVLAGSSLWAVIALFFGFGLLLAFTPCVFPMIPILSGIIAGQGSRITTRRAFVLSLVYVLAMALTYTVAGVLAGLFGANIQAAFQNPWILSAFALVFVALALSMFGFYELQLPSALQSRLAELSNRQEGGTLIGVAIMGLLSALIVGPCVAPPLAGALIFIGQTGDALLGGVALFSLSLGMGAPLIAIGTSAGKLLPRAGAWMEAVKAVFGVALLGVAIMLLERILPAALSMLLWGLLLICSAVYLGALSQLPAAAGGWGRLWKGLGVAMLIYGALMLVGAAAGGKDTLQPLRGLAVLGSGAGGASAVPHASFKRIKSATDLDRELTAARAAGRPVMLDFYADWCVSCKEMERDTFGDPAVQAEMGRFVLLQADVTANDATDQALMQGRFELPGPPAILFFDPTGAELKGFRLVGFKPAREFADHLRRAAP